MRDPFGRRAARFLCLVCTLRADDAALEDSDSFTRPPSSSQCSEAVDICVELASRIKPAKKGLTQGEADLAAIRQMCKV